MPRKFIYGPGLPGYGTAGTDGSAGLTGLAVFFSAYDGNSDTVTIKGKIIANKELFSNDVLIPGYPDRVYQTGDNFIDKNARVFQIDLNEANLYKDTGIFLNTSGFFAEGPPQTLSPGFQRYSNAFETDKFLIDTVYTNTVGDYTQYPSSIYDNMATYFGRVSYIGNDVLADLNGWYPFEIWTIGNNTTGNDAIALARRGDKNEWHFGNFDDGSIRDASLYLDFNDIYCPSVATKSTETDILYWDRTSGRIAQGSAPSGMIMSNYAEYRVITAGNSDTNIYANSNFTFDGSILQINGDVSISKDVFLGSAVDHSIYLPARLTGNAKKITIYTGDVSAGLQYDSGNIEILTGDGGDTAGFYGGNAGGIILSAGNGGDGEESPGDGGIIDISAGRSGTPNPSADGPGPVGGSIRIFAGGVNSTQPSSKGGDIVLIPGDYKGSFTAGGAGGVYLSTNQSGDILGRTYIAKGSPSSLALQFAGAGSAAGFFYTTSPRNGIGIVISGSEQFRFDVSTFHADGNIIAYSSLISDIRLKKNIQDLQPSLDKILTLRGVSYERKSNGEKHVGYIAQEFENLFPELITESEILGEDPSTIYKTIKYVELIPYLSGAIQEQQKHINKLEDKIEFLMKELETIKNKI